jgi:hypothetical protein
MSATENTTTQDILATCKALEAALESLHWIACSEDAQASSSEAENALDRISRIMLPAARLAPMKASPLDHYAGVLAEALMTGGEVPERPAELRLVEHVENGLVSSECLQSAVEGVAAMDAWVAEQQAADRGRR